MPDADWFSMICVIGRDGTTWMDIGGMLKENESSVTDFTAQDSGSLYCFANDLPFMYLNNEGSLLLKIKN